MRTTLTFLIIFMVVNVLNAQKPGYANLHILDPYNPEFVPGEILVKFKDDVLIKVRNTKSQPQTGVKNIDDFIIKHGIKTCTKVFNGEESRKDKSFIKLPDGQTIEVPRLFNVYKFTADSKADIKTLVSALKAELEVEFAEPNYYFYSQATEPNDPMASQQWYLGAFPGVNAKAAWDTTTGDTTQIIGIIDTGVDWTHPDLSPNIWTNWDEIPGNGIDDDGNGKIDDRRGWDFVNNDNNPMDDNSHGTHVAGIAAAKGNNSIGIAGIAWNSKIMPIKVMQSSGFGSSSDIANGVNYARLNGATILNLSLGSYGESLTLKTALENAYSTAVIVAAAGNDGYKIDPPYPPPPVYKPMFPACYPWVLGVMATGQSGGLSGFSNFDPSGPVVYTNSYGHNYETSAPGESILSTFPNGGYHLLNGTSMATPIVSGAVSLLKSHNATLSTEEVFARLIQSATNGTVNIINALNIILVPNLCYISNSVVDTITGGDHDGVPDAGETIQLYLKVKNSGCFADSVWSRIRFAPFEDTTVAIIMDSTSLIGNISTFASMSGETDPFKIFLKPTVNNNRDIMFQYEIGIKNLSSTITGNILLRIQNGIELSGYYPGVKHLHSNRFYIVTNNVVFDTLMIDPGTTVRLNDQKSIGIINHLHCEGKQDSLITFTNNNYGYWSDIKNLGNNSMSLSYCLFEFAAPGYPKSILDNISVSNCIFRDNLKQLFWHLYSSTYIKNSLFYNNNAAHQLMIHRIVDGNLVNNIFYNNKALYNAIINLASDQPIASRNIRNNAFINNTPFDFSYNTNYGTLFSMYKIPPNYWGNSDSANIENRIIDYFENAACPLLFGYDSCLTQPSNASHGIVWKININNILVNKYDNPFNKPGGLGIIGPGRQKFEVFFNRAMDVSDAPFLTFGVREPYTQRVVTDSAIWSADSTKWTAFYNIGIETGDGIQRVRVEGARDNEHFEIPIEDSRFEFVIQAAGSASIEFMATPGIGKVYLEWNRAGTEDALGYNMYRYFNITDSTFSAPIRINSSLITDTLFTDFGVIPDTTYHYYYKVVGTDLQESDSSKIIPAVPLAAANGDANGDMSVSVLDITAVIAYMLNQNPQPFLFEAADVNSDNTINVLDVIGIVDIILGKKKSVSSTITSNPNPVYIYLDKDLIRFKSDGQVAAMQFELAGQNLEQIRLLMKQQGFEFASGIVNGKLLGITYNFENRTIPQGMLNLIGIEGRTSPSWGEVVAGDPDGNYVQVMKDEPQPKPVEDYELKAFPNPFKETVTITYRLPETATLSIQIYNSQGQLVELIENRQKQPGSHQLEWNGKGVPSGIYYCRLNGKTASGKEFNNEVKIVLIK